MLLSAKPNSSQGHMCLTEHSLLQKHYVRVSGINSSLKALESKPSKPKKFITSVLPLRELDQVV